MSGTITVNGYSARWLRQGFPWVYAKEVTGGDFVYTGLQILRTDRVRRHPERVFSLNAVWDRLIDEGRLRGVVYPGDWCDIGHAEGLDLANRMVSGHV